MYNTLGFDGNGMTCNNINECEQHGNETEPRHNCDSQANCSDTPGSFMCECREGYSGNGVTCSGNYL